MILVTHGIVGGALGALVPRHPLVAFGLGFVSHFLLDALPHWDYPLRSGVKVEGSPDYHDFQIGRAFMFDLIKIASDVLAGLAAIISVFVYRDGLAAWPSLAAGFLGGILPDALQFAYFKLRWPTLKKLQEFHMWIHAKRRPAFVPGFLPQALLIGLILLFMITFKA